MTIQDQLSEISRLEVWSSWVHSNDHIHCCFSQVMKCTGGQCFAYCPVSCNIVKHHREPQSQGYLQGSYNEKKNPLIFIFRFSFTFLVIENTKFHIQDLRDWRLSNATFLPLKISLISSYINNCHNNCQVSLSCQGPVLHSWYLL